MILTNHPRPATRPGFTLIELLTVISIIAVLMAISIGAYFRVRVVQEEKATETTLNKLSSEFDVQMRSVLDEGKDEYNNSKIPDGIRGPTGLAGGDNLRAKAIWTKMRIEQEFPQNFWEALKWPQTLQQPLGVYMQPLYAREIDSNYPNSTLNPILPAALNGMPDRMMQESAVLLYLSLTRGRRGNVAFRPNEHLGPHAISRITLTIDPNQPANKPGNTKDFQVFVDTWGTPIGFIRWPFGAVNSDLNGPPYQAHNNSGQPVDPQDPERTLIRSDWSPQLRNDFVNFVRHPLNNPPLNLTPVVMSAGRDARWGIDGTLTRISGDEDDNIYAYRIKGVSRTN